MLIFRALRKAAPYDCINKIFEGMSHRYHRNTQIIVFPFQTKTLKTRFCCLWASPTRFQFVCQWMQARLASLPHESKTAFGLNNISEKPRCRLTPSCVCYSLDSWNSCVPTVASEQSSSACSNKKTPPSLWYRHNGHFNVQNEKRTGCGVTPLFPSVLLTNFYN